MALVLYVAFSLWVVFFIVGCFASRFAGNDWGEALIFGVKVASVIIVICAILALLVLGAVFLFV